MKTRRALLFSLSAGLLALPLQSFAQKKEKVWRVGILASRARPESFDSDMFFGQVPPALRELGYVEEKNVVCYWRWAGGNLGRLPDLAAELVKLQVDVILTDGTAAALALQKATATIPIVFTGVADPVRSGLVKTLARPGGNITGLSVLSAETAAKELEMLMTMIPKLSRVAVLWNPATPPALQLLRSVQAVGKAAGVEVQSAEARTKMDIDEAFSAMSRNRSEALIVGQDMLLRQQLRQIADLAAKHRLPSAAGYREYPEAGGLMSYGTDRTYCIRRGVTYVDKILKGESPGKLPVEQPAKFELVINRKTAKALGLEIPAELLVLADTVIE